mmetsp:Transcript_53378/g.155578  ORF Transcript_53378/g.155578 Transcript_53378/m.155578 type:complete len:316 (-) Transcript_53378:582-1529(-)
MPLGPRGVLGRGEGDKDRCKVCLLERLICELQTVPGLRVGIVLGRGRDPEVGGGQVQLVVVALEAYEEREVGAGLPHPVPNQLPQELRRPQMLGQELCVGRGGSRGADHYRREDVNPTALRHPHAAHVAARVHQQLFHRRAAHERAAMLLEHLASCARNHRGTSHRVGAPCRVVRCNHRVHHERRPRRWHSIVAPEEAKAADERITGAGGAEDLERCLRSPIGDVFTAKELLQGPLQPGWADLVKEVETSQALRLFHRLKVLVHSRRLAGEARLEVLAEPLLPGPDLHALATDHGDIAHLAGLLPLNGAVGDKVH